MPWGKNSCDLRCPPRSVTSYDETEEIRLVSLPSWVTDGKYETEFERNLLISVYQHNIQLFQALVEQKVTDIRNYISVSHTCMEIFCRCPGYSDFIKLFITAKISTNAILSHSGLSPIHVAAISCNSSALEVLLSSQRTNVNRISGQGRTALHYLAETELVNIEKEEAVKRCLDILLKHEMIDVEKCTTTYWTLNGNALHLAARCNNYIVAKALIEDGRINVNAEDEYSWTALHYAVRMRNRPSDLGANKNCAHLLLELPYIDINNRTHERTFRVTALHLAAAVGNSDVLQRLINDKRTNVGILDTRNRNALHYAAEQSGLHSRLMRRDKFTFDTEVKHGEVNFNSPDFYEWIAIHLAANRGNFTNMLVMLQDDACTELSHADTRKSQTSRNGDSESADDADDSDRIRRSVSLLVSHPEIDVNERAFVGLSEKVTPFLLAAKAANYVALDELIRNKRTDVNAFDIDRRTALHYAVDQPDSDKVQRCIDILLKGPEKISGTLELGTPYKHDINIRDRKGNTALHLATKYNAQNTILTLLRYGASIAQRGTFGSPVPYISARTLELFLNECVGSNGKLPEDQDFQLMFTYSFLTRNNIDGPRKFPESDTLYCMISQNKKRRLLRHPVLKSFLHLKWSRIRSYYYVNVVFHLIFVTLLNIFILQTITSSGNDLMSNTADETIFNETENLVNSTHELILNLTETSTMTTLTSERETMRMILKFLTGGFLIKELFQVMVSPWRYCTNIDNYIEILLLLFCCLNVYTSITNRHLAAVAILISWIQLVCLTGRFPFLSCQFEMLKKVSWTFIRFLAWYSFLLIAFALSFYALFFHVDSPKNNIDKDIGANDGDEEGDDNNKVFFQNAGMSLLKSIIMMTGEFDSGSFPFYSAPVTSHIVFTVFVCFIAIVMLNLLNGLAVSDTQAIRQEAEVLSLVSRVRLVYYIESMLLGDPISSHWMSKRLFRYLRYNWSLLRRLHKSISLFPHIVLEKKIWVLPNHHNRVVFTDPLHLSDEKFEVSYNYERSWCNYATLDRDIIKSSMMIINALNYATEMGNIKRSQCKMSQTLKEIECNIKNVKKSVQTQADNQKKLEKKENQSMEILKLKLESNIRDLEYKLYQKFQEIDKVNQENKFMLRNILQKMENLTNFKSESENKDVSENNCESESVNLHL
ncbi:transient receptor potential channel pyrexia-like [Periplaneta americana]|uniref:transient receptor potential channel pyrexia-like n=1 Tax=Periplaneta americana TaxID=6978 RepID=UPI0037E792C2